MTWNVRDQLVGIVGSGLSASFGYDGVGRRITKTLNGQSTTFVHDGVNVVEEFSGGSLSASLLTGLNVDEVFSRTEAGTTRFFLPAALGSTVALTDSAGQTQTEYTYAPFGETTRTGAVSTNPFQFTGRENDGLTGLYYYRARYYHPILQRFLSEDPIGFGGGDVNLYAYVLNNPVNHVDPTGLQSVVVYDRSDSTLYLYPSGDFCEAPPQPIQCGDNGLQEFSARNNTVNPQGNPFTPNSYGPAPNGIFPTGPFIPTGNDPNSAFGTGFVPIYLPPGPSGQRKGVGIHSGRANRGGPSARTLGCIRTTDDAMRALRNDPPYIVQIQD
ncbi:MAG: RHS repeat-associated core domain-containing protein [Candidatus Binatia bacterium]